MKNKRFLFLIPAVSLLLTGCGDEKTGGGENKEPAQTWEQAKAQRVPVKIYLDESNVYGTYVSGTDENIVKEAIEKKFWEDTGNAIDLQIRYESHATFTDNFGLAKLGNQWDAAVSYLGQAGIEETILNDDVTMDISSSLRRYGQHIISTIGQDSLNAVTSNNGVVIGIPSVNLTKQKGVLVRKDYMTAVGYTESREEAENSGGTLTWCRTIKDFDTMVRKMKSENIASTPLSGSVYDMEFTLLAGALDSTGYQYRDINYEVDGTTIKEVVPGWISKNYGKVLQQEYDWVKDGIWEQDNMNLAESNRLSNLASGKTAVYFSNPTVTNLISVARQALDVIKQTKPNASFVLLDPLDAVDGEGKAIENSGAFVEVSKNTDCIVFSKRSRKVDLLIQYFDWMYTSKENYELCAYGVKGAEGQWIESQYGDEYYEYPDEYYITHKPYSGAFMLVHNDLISCRMPMQYTETERNWISKVRNYRCLKNATDGMLFYGCPVKTQTNFIVAEADIYQDCATKAWTGIANPANTWTNCCTAYRNQAGDYIQWLTTQYKQYVANRAQQ